ncbi:MATE family efflux transporter [Parasulfuritortus cantonensis]|uniref:Multidrug-efflux transporter n=1 Tax=Parasulfuritortus cantonensis TaxID=2528202 RepID=A0A4V2NV36_9PROT|nr:MATE family efflux transporter [Parasulfuritortus cantonensis]TCJ11956.1 MATE family efflux transporter [Parasulfuritortus cantonensis]
MKATSLTGELVRLAWPVYVAQIATMASAAIDTVMAGRLSAVDLAVVGVASSIQVTILMSLAGVLFALPALIAHSQGAGRPAEVGRDVHQSLWIAFVLCVVAVLLLMHPEPFLAMSDLRPDVEAKVRAYLDASVWGVPGFMAFRIFFGFSAGIGEPRAVMAYNLVALALKPPLNALFMYGFLGLPAMGAPGCAVATSVEISLIAVLAWAGCLGNRRYAGYRLGAPLARPDYAAIAAYLKLGVPIALTFIADITAFTFMALFIARLGPAVSAAHQIAANLAALAFMLPLSIGNASAILAGQALGAGQPGRARRVCGRGLGLGLVCGGLTSLAFWLGAPWIAAFYTGAEAVRRLAAPLIVLVAAYHLADTVQAIAVNALRGYKRTAIPMVIYTTSLWGLGLGGGVLLGLTDRLGPARGAAGFWLAGIASLALAAGLVALYLDRVSRAAAGR